MILPFIIFLITEVSVLGKKSLLQLREVSLQPGYRRRELHMGMRYSVKIHGLQEYLHCWYSHLTLHTKIFS